MNNGNEARDVKPVGPLCGSAKRISLSPVWASGMRDRSGGPRALRSIGVRSRRRSYLRRTAMRYSKKDGSHTLCVALRKGKATRITGM